MSSSRRRTSGAHEVYVEGTRNDTLFRRMLREAHTAGTEGELLRVAHRFNERHLRPPLFEFEVEKVARSAWKYQSEGRNFSSRRGQFLTIAAVEIEALLAVKHGQDALALFLKLRAAHGARTKRGDTFAVACKAMTAKAVIGPWKSWRRYDRALKILEKCGYLVQVGIPHRRPDGTFEGARWSFSQPGPQNAPNVDITPPVWAEVL